MQNTVLWIILILSALSTIGSLYYGYFGDPVLNWQTGDRWNMANAIVPCNLCWYIRIFTYPIVIISAIGLIHKNPKVTHSIKRLSILALGFCIYKYSLEMGWIHSTSFFCSAGSVVDCAEAKPFYRGFLSLALGGAVVNAIILYCVYIITKSKPS